MRVLFTLQYLGTRYAGWQRQANALAVQQLDENVMHDTAQSLIGKHDFRAFTVIAPEVSSTWRTIESVDVIRDGNTVRLRIAADGFLRYMVRRIPGSLIEIGRGKLEAS